MTWMLKILAGRHTSAKMEIEKSHTILGASLERADCVLVEAGVADEAMSITTNETYIIVKELNNSDWYLNGKLQRNQVSRLMPFDVVQIGTIAFTIGPNNTTWPTIEVPSKKRFHLPWTGLLVSGVLCVGSLNASLYFSKDSLSENNIIRHERIPTHSTLSQPSDADFGLNLIQETQRTIVTGYVADLSSLRVARQSIEKSNPRPLIWKVYRLDQMKTSITTWLNAHGLRGYDIDINKSGVASVKGVMLEDRELSTLTISIKKDIPSLKDITFNVVRLSEILTWLNQMIEQAGIANVGVSNYQESILISGKVSTTQKELIFGLIRNAKAKFGDQISINYKPFVTPDGLLPALKAISTNQIPYVELVGGQKFLEHSVIGDGFIIHTITDEGISLSKDGQNIWIAPGG